MDLEVFGSLIGLKWIAAVRPRRSILKAFLECQRGGHDRILILAIKPDIHHRSFISSTIAVGGAMRQPMQNSMNSATSSRWLRLFRGLFRARDGGDAERAFSAIFWPLGLDAYLRRMMSNLGLRPVLPLPLMR